MVRVFAIVGVLAAFGAALYFSGDYLAGFEAPEPPAKAAPAPPAKKKPKRAARAARKAPKREVAWLADLNLLCRRSRVAADMIPPPSGADDVARYIREFEERNSRLNRQAAELIERSGDAKTTAALRELFAQEEQLVHRMLAAARNGDERQLRSTMGSLLAVGKSQNRLLTRLGALDCTVPPQFLDLY